MKIALPLLLFVALAPGANPVQGADPMVEVEMANVTAGDLAAVAPAFTRLDPAAALTRAPALGVVRRVSRYELTRWAESAGLQVGRDELPETLLIRRKTRLLAAEEVVAAIRQAAANSQGASVENVSVMLHGFAPRAIPAAVRAVEVSALPRKLNEPQAVRLRWRDPGGGSGVEAFQATLRIAGSWLVARSDLSAKTRLGGADVREVRGFLPARGDTLLRPEQLADSPQLYRDLRAGQTLQLTDVRFAPLVERGALVELRLELGTVRLRTPARAEEAGGKGELIACRNLESGRRVLGRIVTAGVVVLEAGYAR